MTSFEESARSPLCQLPLYPSTQSRVSAALETIDLAENALDGFLHRFTKESAVEEDGDLGEYLLLLTIQHAMAHAKNMLRPDPQGVKSEFSIPVTPAESEWLEKRARKEGKTPSELLATWVKDELNRFQSH